MREIHTLCDAKILKEISIGFIPVEVSPRRDSNQGLHFTRVELIEASLVGVPAHPQALVQMKSLGISEQMQRAVFREYTLGARIRAAKRANPQQDIARMARDLAFDERTQAFARNIERQLDALRMRIAEAYVRYAASLEGQDIAEQLKRLREIEKLEHSEASLMRAMPKLARRAG